MESSALRGHQVLRRVRLRKKAVVISFTTVFCSLYKVGINRILNIISINTIYTANFEQEFPPPETICEICTVFCLSCKN